jgi:hypothetical protein
MWVFEKEERVQDFTTLALVQHSSLDLKRMLVWHWSKPGHTQDR